MSTIRVTLRVDKMIKDELEKTRILEQPKQSLNQLITKYICQGLNNRYNKN